MNSYKLIEQGAGRYVVGSVKPYDQKNEMFKRPFWDPQMLDLGERFYRKPVMPKDESGYRLQHPHRHFCFYHGMLRNRCQYKKSIGRRIKGHPKKTNE